MVVALVRTFTAVLLRKLDPSSLDPVNGAYMHPVSSDDFHVLFDFHIALLGRLSRPALDGRVARKKPQASVGETWGFGVRFAAERRGRLRRQRHDNRVSRERFLALAGFGGKKGLDAGNAEANEALSLGKGPRFAFAPSRHQEARHQETEERNSLMLLIIALAAMLARDPQLPAGASCDQVRAYVSQYGRVRSVAWAIRQGYSLAQIREARKCLR
jgi:hypothetical protein